MKAHSALVHLRKKDWQQRFKLLVGKLEEVWRDDDDDELLRMKKLMTPKPAPAPRPNEYTFQTRGVVTVIYSGPHLIHSGDRILIIR